MKIQHLSVSFANHSILARVKAVKGSIWKNTILLKVQKASSIFGINFWVTKKKLNIEIKDYWTIPQEYLGFEMPYMPRRMGNSYGDYIEVWKPDQFDIDSRANELLQEYVNSEINNFKANIKLKQSLTQ